MNVTLYRFVCLAALAWTLAACGSDPVIVPMEPDTQGTTPDVVEDPTVMVTGVVFDTRSNTPVGAFEVCVAGTDPPVCASTDATGQYALETPTGVVELQAMGSGYRVHRTVFDTETDATVDWPAVSETSWSELQTLTGGQGQTGLIARFQQGTEREDVTPLNDVNVQLLGYTGVGGLTDLSGEPSQGEATGPDGLALFVDVTEGDHTLLATHKGGACLPTYGTDAGGLSVEMVTDHITVVSFDCIVVVDDSITLTGSMIHYQTREPMAEVEVCFAESDDEVCTKTSADGTYVLPDVPPTTNGMLTTRATDFRDTHTPLNSQDGTPVSAALSPKGSQRIAVTPDPTEDGTALMMAYDATTIIDGDLSQATPLEGVSFVLTPTAGAGPYYAAGDGVYSNNAPATFGIGEGAIFLLPTGTYSVRYTHPWGTCVPGHGLTVGDNGALSFHVAPGVETWLAAVCTVSPPETSSVIGRTHNLLTGEVLVDTEVCLQTLNETGVTTDEFCTTSDQDGNYELTGVPSNAIRTIRFQHDSMMKLDAPLNVGFGVTYYARMYPTFVQSIIYDPMVEAGRCDPVEDWETYDGGASWGGRIYDVASTADSFFQGVWIDRAQATAEVIATGEVLDWPVYIGANGLPEAERDETSTHGLMYNCKVDPGLHRISFSHPWGECWVGNKLPPEEDGSYVHYFPEGITQNIGGECALTPPGNLAQELENYPPLASMHLLMETAGELEGLSLAELPPEGLTSAERVTLLAPSDAALSAYLLNHGQLGSEDREQLIAHHMIQGELEADELVTEENLWTMAGTPIRFVEDPDGTIRIDGTSATVIESEHWAVDGIIYILDEVLDVPEDPASTVTEVSAASNAADSVGGFQLSHETWETAFPAYPTFTVYTPPGYYDDAPSGYPVLYVLHDLGGDHHSFFGGPTMAQNPTSSLAQVADTLINSGGAPPMIIVGLNGMNQAYGSYYTDSVTDIGASAFGDYRTYVSRVMEQVESTYNTSTVIDGPQNRAILGHGMGGFGAVHIASDNPIFSAVIIHSGLLSLTDLLLEDATVAAAYADPEVDGSLWSEVMHAWTATHGTDLLDGRLASMAGPAEPAISRLIALASAFTPLKAFFTEFDTSGSTAVGEGLVTDIDGDPTNNTDYPVVAVDTQLTVSIFDDTYIGFRLPWSADGTLSDALWTLWSAHEPISAVESAAEELIAADTDFFIDCGTGDERGFADQAEWFSGSLVPLLAPGQISLELYPGTHDSAIYTERLYASLLWLAGVLGEEAEASAP